jgi:hypothetical protein
VQETAPPPSTEDIDHGYGASLIDLTDEELQAVDPLPPEQRLVILPFFDQLPEAEQDTATIVAFRGLAARGLVGPPTEEQVDAAMRSGAEPAPIEIGVNEVIAGILRTRKVAPTIVCAQRTVAGRSDYCYWYVIDGEAAIEEFVETKGLHRFRAMETGLVPLALYGYLNPERAEGRAGETLTVDAAVAVAGQTPALALEQLSQAHSIGEFVVRNGPRPAAHPLMVGVASGPEGLHLAEVRFGSGEPVVMRPVAAATLYERIGQHLRLP